jgi:hypothetical protein
MPNLVTCAQNMSDKDKSSESKSDKKQPDASAELSPKETSLEELILSDTEVEAYHRDLQDFLPMNMRAMTKELPTLIEFNLIKDTLNEPRDNESTAKIVDDSQLPMLRNEQAHQYALVEEGLEAYELLQKMKQAYKRAAWNINQQYERAQALIKKQCETIKAHTR